jgi:hypothetical protein
MTATRGSGRRTRWRSPGEEDKTSRAALTHIDSLEDSNVEFLSSGGKEECEIQMGYEVSSTVLELWEKMIQFVNKIQIKSLCHFPS